MKKYIKFIAISGLILLVPFFIYAQGLVPCQGINCSLCSFFELFIRIFDFIKALVPVFAIGLIMYGGFLYITSAGSSGALTKAKSILLNTVIGVAIFYSAYILASAAVSILAVRGGAQSLGFNGGRFDFACNVTGTQNTMDDLIKNGIKLDLNAGYIAQDANGNVIPIEEGGITTGNIVPEGNYARSEGINVSGLTIDVKDGLNKASSELRKDGITTVVTSGYRSLQVQKDTAIAHCTPDSLKNGLCENLPGKSIACVPKDGGKNCPHTTGQAVDVSGINSQGTGCVQGVKVVDPDCQNKVIDAMKAQGFCVLVSPDEPWHFEKPPVTKNGRDCPIF